MGEKTKIQKSRNTSKSEADISQELVEMVNKDLEITERALKKLKVIAPKKSYAYKIAIDLLGMAQAYYKDAQHFREKNDHLRALACVNYAHGWLDAGARLGIFDVSEDDRLFTLAE